MVWCEISLNPALLMLFLFKYIMFQLNYRKNKNVELFKDIQEKMGVSKVQNYISHCAHF